MFKQSYWILLGRSKCCNDSFLARFSSECRKESAPKNNKLDIIGPPDPVSNLRSIVFAKNENESRLEKQYREARESTQSWNQHFWTKHNSRFVNERKEFQRNFKEETGKESVTADEMSVFYKQFLDKNWRTHLEYNKLWYMKNIKILILEIKVRLSKIKLR